MEKFIKIQLFGDSSEPPQPTPGPNPTGDGQNPAPGDNAPNDADILYQFDEQFVPRKDYDALMKDKERILASVWRHTEKDLPEVQKKAELQKMDVDKLSAETFKENCKLTDLQYIENVLKIREARMAQGYPDPFAPANRTKDDPFAKAMPSAEDLEIAQKVADGLQHCVDEANGDNASFLLEYQKITREMPRLGSMLRRN